jgi:hypothetical protein
MYLTIQAIIGIDKFFNNCLYWTTASLEAARWLFDLGQAKQKESPNSGTALCDPWTCSLAGANQIVVMMTGAGHLSLPPKLQFLRPALRIPQFMAEYNSRLVLRG